MAICLELIQQKPIIGWGYRATWMPIDPSFARINNSLGWTVPSSHNAILEIALELGIVGALAWILILGQAMWRALRCCATGIQPLGWFTLVFLVGTVIGGQTVETVGQNQVIEWVVFNVLLICCGRQLTESARNSKSYSRAHNLLSGRAKMISLRS